MLYARTKTDATKNDCRNTHTQSDSEEKKYNYYIGPKMNVFQSEVDMFLEIYLDFWDHKLNEKLLFIIFVYYFALFPFFGWRESHKHTNCVFFFVCVCVYHDNP